MNGDDFKFWSAEMNSATPALDVHGYSISAAIHELDFFIDRAVMQGAEVIKVIHGAGTGALRAAVHEALSADKRVMSIRDSERSGEGGAVLYAILR